MYEKKYYYLMGIAVIIDQLTKYLAQLHLSFYSPFKLISNALSLQLVHNPGAAYGILPNQRILLLSISIIFIIICILFRDKIANTKYSKIGLAFLLSGTIGNFIDRLLLGYVIDFININIFPVFNFADVFIDIGIVFLILDLFINNEKNKESATR